MKGRDWVVPAFESIIVAATSAYIEVHRILWYIPRCATDPTASRLTFLTRMNGGI